MIKKIIIISSIIIIALIAFFTVKCENDKNIRLFIDDQEISTYNRVVKRTNDFQVPITNILDYEKIGYSQAKTKFIVQTDPKITFTTDHKKALCGEEEETMDSYFVQIDNYFLVSLNYISEKLNYTYTYDSKEAIIYIESN